VGMEFHDRLVLRERRTDRFGDVGGGVAGR
jgi:hypothetical protein